MDKSKTIIQQYDVVYNKKLRSFGVYVDDYIIPTLIGSVSIKVICSLPSHIKSPEKFTEFIDKVKETNPSILHLYTCWVHEQTVKTTVVLKKKSVILRTKF
jgi:hypothetical protein